MELAYATVVKADSVWGENLVNVRRILSEPPINIE